MNDYDPRLVDLYDQDNPDGPDHEFYRSLAAARGSRSILDLGCGTGLLAVSLAAPGTEVVGVDPSSSMLAYAKRRDGADAVSWVLGDSRDIPHRLFDFAVMTGNVAQHVPEEDWGRTLRDLRRALRVGGTLAFESRSPSSRAWESWAAAEPTSRETPHGTLVEWMEAAEIAPGTVRLVAHNLFSDLDEEVIETQLFAFRDRGAIERQLVDAGFEIESVHGDWERTPFAPDAPQMIFVALAA